MEAKDFTAWIEHMGWNDAEVARRLEISRNTVTKYKGEGAPPVVGLACQALAMSQQEWKPFSVAENPTYLVVSIKRYGAPDNEEPLMATLVKNVVDEHGALTEMLLRTRPRATFADLDPLPPTDKRLLTPKSVVE